MTTHEHSVEPWSFPVPAETEVITTRQVLEGAPVLLAQHGPTGEWLLHCGSTQSLDDKRTGCLGCVASTHPEVVELCDLPRGHHANRNTDADPWERFGPRKSVKELLQPGIDAEGFQLILQPPERPIWAFTIGLQATTGQPEVMMIGLPPQMLHQMMMNLATSVTGGEEIHAGLRTDEVLQNLTCELRPVNTVWHDVLFPSLSAYYEGAPFSVLQCLWPDKQGRMPFDDDYDPGLRARQPYLEHADPERASMTPLLRALGR